MVDETDWRIETKGHDTFKGLVFEWRAWAPTPAQTWAAGEPEPTPSTWDHDHCHFCTATFAPQFLEAGYVAPDPRPEPEEPISGASIAERWQAKVQEPLGEYELWVCPECFADLSGYYGWTTTR